MSLYEDACRCEYCGSRFWAGEAHVCPPLEGGAMKSEPWYDDAILGPIPDPWAPLATTSSMEQRHMQETQTQTPRETPRVDPSPLVYGVWRRGDLLAVYDNEAAAVEHASTIEAKEHATVSVDLWKVRKTFDVINYNKAHALRKLAPDDQKALGLDLAGLAKEVMERGLRVYNGTGGARAGKEFLNRE